MDNTSQTGQLRGWEGLANACRADSELEDFLRGDLDVFDEALREVWRALARSSKLNAEKRKATRDLQDAMATARDQARQIRLGLQLRLGPRNERLAMFGMKPLQAPRPRKPPKP